MNSKHRTFYRNRTSIVDCAWLNSNLHDANVRIFDCSTFLNYTDDHPTKPYDVVSGLSEYKKAHIPNSAFLDLQNSFSKQGSAYSFTLPELTDLAVAFQNVGVGNNSHVTLFPEWSSMGYEILVDAIRCWLQKGKHT